MKLFIFAALLGGITLASCTKTEQEINLNDTQRTDVSGNVPAIATFCDEGDNEDPQPMLRGNVTTGAPATPVYHACVELRTSTGTFVAIIGTDSAGHYYFNTVSNGNYYILVNASGFAPSITPVTVSGTPQNVNVVL